MERHRLFVAIDLPEEVKSHLARLARGLAGGRRVPVEQLHLTLRFIGDTETPALEKLKSALKEVAAESFSLEVGGIGHFPPSRFPRVLWVGVTPSPVLLRLQEEVELAVQSAGIPPDSRPFSPHITIARLKDAPLDRVRRFELEQGSFTAGSFTVESFHLYASRLSAAGAVHTVIESYPL